LYTRIKAIMLSGNIHCSNNQEATKHCLIDTLAATKYVLAKRTSAVEKQSRKHHQS
jgi:hypothetical protein